MHQLTNVGFQWIKQEVKYWYMAPYISPNFCALCSVVLNLNLSRMNNEQNWHRRHFRCHHLGYSMGTSYRATLHVLSYYNIVPFGTEATSDLVVQAWAIPPPSSGLLDLPMAPRTDDNAIDKTKRHLNLATRDFTHYITVVKTTIKIIICKSVLRFCSGENYS